MALVSKISNVGIDVIINEIQTLVYNTLTSTNYESYSRAYKNETRDESQVQKYEVWNAGDEYKEVFLSDRFNATSFFSS